jgi:hypothetical protein
MPQKFKGKEALNKFYRRKLIMKKICLYILMVSIGGINLLKGDENFFAEVTNQSLRRIKNSLDFIHQELSSLGDKPLISEWNIVFHRMNEAAKRHPGFFQEIKLGFVNCDDTITQFSFFMPKNFRPRRVRNYSQIFICNDS